MSLKSVRRVLGNSVEFFCGGPPLPHAWGPPLPHRDPSLTRTSFFSFTPHSPTSHVRHGTFFWTPHYTPPSPHARHGTFFPKCTPNLATKGAFRPLLAVKFWAWQATAARRSVSCTPAWAGRSTGTESTPCGLTWPDSPLAQRVHPAERPHRQAHRAASCLESV